MPVQEAQHEEDVKIGSNPGTRTEHDEDVTKAHAEKL